jgi:hypothetical protein
MRRSFLQSKYPAYSLATRVVVTSTIPKITFVLIYKD